MKLLLWLCGLLFASQGMAKDSRMLNILLSGDKESVHVLASKGGEFSFHLPQMAGNFRLGISNGEKSLWLSDLKQILVKQQHSNLTYTISDPLMGKGTLILRVSSLSDSNGLIMEIEAKQINEDIQLVWVFGGCYGKVLDDTADGHLDPTFCTYNVFSVEGTAFTTYYGESMNLKVIQGITPFSSDIRLSDAHQQESPDALLNSGKKTDAPVLSASLPLKNDEDKLYFCFYTQNAKADYNYYMLPALFMDEFNRK